MRLQSSKFVQKNETSQFYLKEENWGSCKWLRFQKSDPRLILFTKTLIRFFLSLKHPHAFTLFSHSLNHSVVDKKNFRKKNSQSFFMRHFYYWNEFSEKKSEFFTLHIHFSLENILFPIGIERQHSNEHLPFDAWHQQKHDNWQNFS